MRHLFTYFLLLLIVMLFLVTCSLPTNTNQVAKPVFSIPGGTYYLPITVSISCPTDSSEIRYTIDGTTPDENSRRYSGPISVTSSLTLKAIALKNGMDNSRISIVEYIAFSPPIVGRCSDGGGSNIEISGNYAFVTRNQYPISELKIVNISNPSHPYVVRNIEIPYYCNDIAVAEDYVYVLAANSLLIIDISHPSSAYIKGSCAISGPNTDVEVSGHYAYVTSQEEPAILIVDVGNPTSPFLASSFSVSPDYFFRDLALKDNRLYGLCRVGGANMCMFISWNISNPLVPQFDYQIWALYGWDIAVSDLQFYILAEGDYYDGIYSIFGHTFFPIPGNPLNLTLSNNYAYVTCGYSGLKVIDLTVPSTPVIVGTCDLPDNGSAVDVRVAGNYAYVVGTDLYIISITP